MGRDIPEEGVNRKIFLKKTEEKERCGGSAGWTKIS